MFNGFKDLVYPKKCLGCGSWGQYICSSCVNYFKILDKAICPMCNKPSAFGLTHPICLRPLGLNGLTAVFPYNGLIKKAIIKLKYQFISDFADTIMEILMSFIGEDKGFTGFLNDTKIILVPVPIHPKREKWRGYNQSKLLGKIITNQLGIYFTPDLLIKIRNTLPQAKLSKKERHRNVKKAFVIDSSKIKFKPAEYKAIIFDDVWTTGATLKECTKCLKRVGFKKVWALTLSRQI